MEGDGNTVDGAGKPPAAVVPDPGPVTNTTPTMGCPGLSCSYEGCEYKTPGYSASDSCCALELHIMANHPQVYKTDAPPTTLLPPSQP